MGHGGQLAEGKTHGQINPDRGYPLRYVLRT